MASPTLRAAFRRHLDLLRLQRKPPRRFQSSQTGSSPNSKTAKTEDPIPVPSTVAPLPFWQRLGPLTRTAEAYARAQRKRPYVTQVASALVIYLGADISAQRMSGKDYDIKRTARSLAVGAFAAIPNYTWFMFLSHHFNYSSRIISIGTKVLVNQICFTPLFNTYFFGSQALLSGDTLQETWERITRTVPISIINSCKLWPAITAFSFAFLPMEYRSIFTGFIAVGWQTYLSFLNRQAELDEAKANRISIPGQEEKTAIEEGTAISVRDAKRRIAA
ncbi:uncharacterized protein BCR38DRAFT_368127 [Pseudomassariella vexata]|uniref:Mpv17/PMP22 family protein n=1 Tax=Pseudomassariella vexata TaxID=1141098 RepID=A0A1Y2E0R2_9PEZI|nr:uncharacterized protein BCR38DRAFT_368127 [Pseudomassariella vexata]ORY65122.1 hypothetical protein BCR38DRAFT_368127 [Pseudomassariella vexata]